MKNKQKNNYSKFELLTAIMNKHKKVWDGIEELAKSNDAFVQNFKKLSDHKAVLSFPMAPVVDVYNEKRTELSAAILSVKDALAVYANDTKKKGLAERVSVKTPTVKKMKDSDLIKLAEVVCKALEVKEGKKEKEKIDPAAYGLDNMVVEKVEGLKEDFKDAVQIKEERAKAICKAKKALVLGIEKGNNILKNRMDPFVKLFKESGSEFYSEYRAARKGKDAAGKTDEQRNIPAKKSVVPKAATDTSGTSRSTSAKKPAGRIASKARNTSSTRSTAMKTATKSTSKELSRTSGEKNGGTDQPAPES